MTRERPLLDNLHLDIVSEGRAALELALELALLHTPGGAVRAECEHPTLGLVFFWSLPPKSSRAARLLRDTPILDEPPRLGVALPEVTEFVQTATIKGYGTGRRLPGLLARVEKYLQGVRYAPPSRSLDDVGRCKGFRLYTEVWGRVGSSDYSIFAVQPAWAFQGK